MGGQADSGRDMMGQEHRVGELRVTLGAPRQVRESVGYCWFPNIARFPSGELMVTAILSADATENLFDAYSVTHSSDGGQTWSWFYDVAGWGGGCIARIPQPDGSIAGPDFYIYPDPPGQARSFAGHFDHFEDGARRFVRDAFGLRVEGLPRDVKIHGDGGKWSKHWPANLVFFGNYVDVGDEVLTTTHLVYAGETRYSQIALASADRGKTWRYRSTVAASDVAPDGREGPNESSVVRLETGELMCVMRVGRIGEDGRNAYAPLARAYSRDDGRTWSEIDRLPAAGVAPCLRRLSNGVLALTTGRPGIALWLSDDPRGTQWRSLDLLEHHNALLSDAHHQIRPARGHNLPDDPDQTTAYTDFVETAPGRLLMTYDRIPYGWRGTPIDSADRSRIYVMEIDVQHD